MKIVKAEISAMPRPMPEGMFDPMPAVNVEYEDGTKEKLFEFYPDEILFFPTDFVGMTRQEALDLFHRRDVAYLQKP